MLVRLPRAGCCSGDRLQRRDPARCRGERACRLSPETSCRGSGRRRWHAVRGAPARPFHACLRARGRRRRWTPMMRSSSAPARPGDRGAAAGAARLARRSRGEERVPAPKSLRRVHVGEQPAAARPTRRRRRHVRALAGPGSAARVGLFCVATPSVDAPMPRAEARCASAGRSGATYSITAVGTGASGRRRGVPALARRRHRPRGDAGPCRSRKDEERYLARRWSSPRTDRGSRASCRASSTSSATAPRPARLQGAFPRRRSAARSDAAARLSRRLWRHGVGRRTGACRSPAASGAMCWRARARYATAARPPKRYTATSWHPAAACATRSAMPRWTAHGWPPGQSGPASAPATPTTFSVGQHCRRVASDHRRGDQHGDPVGWLLASALAAIDPRDAVARERVGAQYTKLGGSSLHCACTRPRASRRSL